jgi:sulfur-carrier protein
VPKVRYYASLRQVTGKREEEFQVGTVKEMLNTVSKAYQGKLDRYLKISTVLVNGKNVIHLKGRKTRLAPDDVVAIFPPMGGG